jgi:hypothetical protein
MEQAEQKYPGIVRVGIIVGSAVVCWALIIAGVHHFVH